MLSFTVMCILAFLEDNTAMSLFSKKVKLTIPHFICGKDSSQPKRTSVIGGI